MIRFGISEFKIGDTVMRTKGIHSSGMKEGCVAKIVDIMFHNNRVFISLDKYHGWHSQDNFKKTTERNFTIKKSKIEKYQHELELAKKKVLELESKLNKVNKTQMIKLDVEYTSLLEISGRFDNMEFYQQDRKVVCYIKDKDKIKGKGVAIAMHEDEFDLNIGCKLALYRAQINMCRRIECKIIKDTF